jgi:hypothetical protein
MTPPSTSPYNPGVLTATTAALVAGSSITNDLDGLLLSTTAQTVQYDFYAAPLPKLTTCPGAPFSAPFPIEQVINYALASGGVLSLASGDHEVEFNYGPTMTGVAGTASFTVAGVTYTSTGGVLPTGNFNDFLFSSTGKLLGSLGQDQQDNPTLTAGVPAGWIMTSGGGGTVSAPEIDSSTAIAALTLLAGGILVIGGRRRSER